MVSFIVFNSLNVYNPTEIHSWCFFARHAIAMHARKTSIFIQNYFLFYWNRISSKSLKLLMRWYSLAPAFSPSCSVITLQECYSNNQGYCHRVIHINLFDVINLYPQQHSIQAYPSHPIACTQYKSLHRDKKIRKISTSIFFYFQETANQIKGLCIAYFLLQKISFKLMNDCIQIQKIQKIKV